MTSAQKTEGSALTPFTKRKRVVVVGVGASGLLALRYFGDDPSYSVVAYELQNRIGGLWNYPDNCADHSDATQGSEYYSRMYRDLRTNSPKDLTHFTELNLPETEESYVPRSMVFNYIHEYARKFNLHRFIKLRHRVQLIEPVINSGLENSTKWKVVVQDGETGVTFTEICNNVILCSGRYDKPHIPTIPTMDVYKGQISHSGQYRIPEPFVEKNVLIIGGGPSGQDITCELLSAAKKIILSCRRQKSLYEQFPNVLEIGTDISFTETGIILPNGTPEQIDHVILCTGFEMNFPFFSANCGLEVTRGQVYPLYRHLINCRFPSMAIIGLLGYVPFLGAGSEMQVKYYKALVDGHFKLPSTSDMIKDTDADLDGRAKMGLRKHESHTMLVHVFPYIRRLAEEAGLPPAHAPVLEKIYQKHVETIFRVPHDFRNYRFTVVDSENFTHERLPK